jgi:hypothetical protein
LAIQEKGKKMEICERCKAQVKKQKNAGPHEYLKRVGGQRQYIGWPTGGYEEQDYICQECGAELTYSNDKNNYGWTLKELSRLHHRQLHCRANKA